MTDICRVRRWSANGGSACRRRPSSCPRPAAAGPSPPVASGGGSSRGCGLPTAAASTLKPCASSTDTSRPRTPSAGSSWPSSRAPRPGPLTSRSAPCRGRRASGGGQASGRRPSCRRLGCNGRPATGRPRRTPNRTAPPGLSGRRRGRRNRHHVYHLSYTRPDGPDATTAAEAVARRRLSEKHLDRPVGSGLTFETIARAGFRTEHDPKVIDDILEAPRRQTAWGIAWCCRTSTSTGRPSPDTCGPSPTTRPRAGGRTASRPSTCRPPRSPSGRTSRAGSGLPSSTRPRRWPSPRARRRPRRSLNSASRWSGSPGWSAGPRPARGMGTVGPRAERKLLDDLAGLPWRGRVVVPPLRLRRRPEAGRPEGRGAAWPGYWRTSGRSSGWCASPTRRAAEDSGSTTSWCCRTTRPRPCTACSPGPSTLRSPPAGWRPASTGSRAGGSSARSSPRRAGRDGPVQLRRPDRRGGGPGRRERRAGHRLRDRGRAGPARLPRVQVPAEQFAAMNWPAECWGARTVVHAGQGNRDHLRAAIQMLSDAAPPDHLHPPRVAGDRRGLVLPARRRGRRPGRPEPGGVLRPARRRRPVRPARPAGRRTTCGRRSGRPSGCSTAGSRTGRLPARWRPCTGRCLDRATSPSTWPGRPGRSSPSWAALAQQHFGPGMDARHLPGNWSQHRQRPGGAGVRGQGRPAGRRRLRPGRDRGRRPAAEPGRPSGFLRAQGNGSGRQRMTGDASPPAGEAAPRADPGDRRGRAPRAEHPGPAGGRRAWAGAIIPAAALSECQRDAAAGHYARVPGRVRGAGSPRGTAQSGPAGGRAGRAAGPVRRPPARTPARPAAVANLLLGLRYLLAFAAAVGAITGPERDDLWRRGEAAFDGVAGGAGGTSAAADPVDFFLRLVRSAVEQRPGPRRRPPRAKPPGEGPEAWGWRSRALGTGEHERVEWQPQGHRVGWLDDGLVFLEPDGVYAEAQRLAGEQGQSIPLAPRTLYRRLNERGLLARVEESAGKVRFCVRRVLEGQRREVLCFHAGTLFAAESAAVRNRRRTAPGGWGAQPGHSTARSVPARRPSAPMAHHLRTKCAATADPKTLASPMERRTRHTPGTGRRRRGRTGGGANGNDRRRGVVCRPAIPGNRAGDRRRPAAVAAGDPGVAAGRPPDRRLPAGPGRDPPGRGRPGPVPRMRVAARLGRPVPEVLRPGVPDLCGDDRELLHPALHPLR